MASIFDIGILDNFSSIFVLLFIIVAIYAILQGRKFMGLKPALHFTIAFAIGMIFIFSDAAIQSVKNIIPWLMVFMIGFVMLLIAISIFVGADPISYLVEQGAMGTWYNFMFIIGIVVIGLGVASSVGQDVGPHLSGENNTVTAAANTVRGSGSVATGNFQQNLGATIFHPKVLSLILTFFILAMAAFWITKVPM